MASQNKLLTPSWILEQEEERLRRRKEKELQAKLMNLKPQDNDSIIEPSGSEEE